MTDISPEPKRTGCLFITLILVIVAIVIGVAGLMMVESKARSIVYRQLDEFGLKGELKLEGSRLRSLTNLGFNYSFHQIEEHEMGELVNVGWTKVYGPWYVFESEPYNNHYSYGGLKRLHKKLDKKAIQPK